MWTGGGAFKKRGMVPISGRGFGTVESFHFCQRAVSEKPRLTVSINQEMQAMLLHIDTSYFYTLQTFHQGYCSHWSHYCKINIVSVVHWWITYGYSDFCKVTEHIFDRHTQTYISILCFTYYPVFVFFIVMGKSDGEISIIILRTLIIFSVIGLES